MLNASTRVEGSDRPGLGALVAVGQPLGDLGDLAVVGAGEGEQAHLLEAGGGQAPLDHLADAGDRALADRAGDHPGLAEAAAAGAAAEDLDRHALVHRLGQGHERLLGVGPRVEVHHGVLGHPPRDAVGGRDHALDPAVGQVVDRVERGHVDAAGAGQPHQQLLTPAGAALCLPRADEVGDLEHRLLPVADDRGVDEVGDRLGVERRVAAGDDDRVLERAVPRVQRDAGEVQRGEHVGVAELGGEGEAEHVEVAHAAVTVDGELRAPPCSRSSASMSDHTAYERSARASGRSLRTS